MMWLIRMCVFKVRVGSIAIHAAQATCQRMSAAPQNRTSLKAVGRRAPVDVSSRCAVALLDHERHDVAHALAQAGELGVGSLLVTLTLDLAVDRIQLRPRRGELPAGERGLPCGGRLSGRKSAEQ